MEFESVSVEDRIAEVEETDDGLEEEARVVVLFGTFVVIVTKDVLVTVESANAVVAMIENTRDNAAIFISVSFFLCTVALFVGWITS